MYTIDFLSGDESQRSKVLLYLTERMVKEGKFYANFHLLTIPSRQGARPGIGIKPVRLVKAKPYCGNHPGVCLNPTRKKPVAKYLEWDDWVKFHNLVNRVLNRFHVNANVWSTPPDVRGKMHIRKGLRARKRYDFEETISNYGHPIRAWNPGTEDQFA